MSAPTPDPPRPPETPQAAQRDSTDQRARDRRLAPVVEAFLRQVRSGGSLDPEPFLRAVGVELRAELEVLLRGVLRLEQISDGLDRCRREREGGGEDLIGP
ncbi:MAG: hypothetical protein AAGG01_07490 [Planctomycetota bacterium]